MGSGKTLIGALVAERARAPFFDLDRVVERKAGMSIVEIFATRSEQAFRALEKQELSGVLRPGAVVALGGGAVMDAENWALISARAITVYLEVPFDLIWDRIRQPATRPLTLNRDRSEVEALLESRRARYEEAEHRVDANRDAGIVAEEVLQLWSA